MSQTPRTDEWRAKHDAWLRYCREFGHIPEAMEQAPKEADPFGIAVQLETELAAMQERAGKAEAQAQKLLEDAERWVEVERRMVHQHSGPNVGWTLHELLPGESPAEAIDAARRKP